jgi:tripartite ATP-independent transporter DctP family solute receptor
MKKSGKMYKGLTFVFMSFILVTLTSCGSAKPATGVASSSPAPAASPGTATPVAAAPSNVKERTLKIGIELAKTHPQGQAMIKFGDLLKEKSGGKIKSEIFYDSTLGNAKKILEQLQGGLQDVGVIDPANMTGDIKELGVYGLPFVFNNEKEVDAVLDGPFGQQMLERLPAKNWIGLTYWENGFRDITNNKHPINTIDDMKGLKLRTMQNKIHLDAFGALGVNPVPMAFAELYTALETKTVDGQENPLLTIESQKFYEVQKYLTLSHHVYSPFILLVSKKLWDQLSDEEKKMFKDAGVESGKFQREISREQSKKTLDKLKSDGMQVSELTPEVKKQIQDKIQPVIDKYTQELGADVTKQLFDEIKKVRGN